VTPLLSLLGAAALVAAPLQPGGVGKSGYYQTVADGLEWKAPGDDPARSLAAQLPDYQVEVEVVLSGGNGTETVRIYDRDKERYAWDEHGHRVAFVRDGVVYRADYHAHSSGCSVIAFDLMAGKELWKASLKGLGPIDHSKYRNRVRMERIDNAVFPVYGQESAGRYVEMVDFKTGQTVGHKVFPRE
jgi:hypothetical protein